jgi:hypothetical protein
MQSMHSSVSARLPWEGTMLKSHHNVKGLYNVFGDPEVGEKKRANLDSQRIHKV